MLFSHIFIDRNNSFSVQAMSLTLSVAALFRLNSSFLKTDLAILFNLNLFPQKDFHETTYFLCLFLNSQLLLNKKSMTASVGLNFTVLILMLKNPDVRKVWVAHFWRNFDLFRCFAWSSITSFLPYVIKYITFFHSFVITIFAFIIMNFF